MNFVKLFYPLSPICGGIANMYLKDNNSFDTYYNGIKIGIIAPFLPVSGFVFGFAMAISDNGGKYSSNEEEYENTTINRFKTGFMSGVFSPINIINKDEFEISIKKRND
jgi:hypothetical protein